MDASFDVLSLEALFLVPRYESLASALECSAANIIVGFAL